MKNYRFQRENRLLLLILVCTITCIGQMQLPKKNLAEQPQIINVNRTTTSYFPNCEAYCGLEDKTGNLWFGTSNGVFGYNRRLNDTARQASLNDLVRQEKNLNGILWIGARKGICSYDNRLNDVVGYAISFTNLSEKKSRDLNLKTLLMKTI